MASLDAFAPGYAACFLENLRCRPEFLSSREEFLGLRLDVPLKNGIYGLQCQITSKTHQAVIDIAHIFV